MAYSYMDLGYSVPLFYLNLMQGSEGLPNDHEPQEFSDLDAARTKLLRLSENFGLH